MLQKLYNLVTTVVIMMASPAEANSLHTAVRDNNLGKVKELLAGTEGRTLREGRDEVGKTPLLLATELNRVEAARALIEAGADVNAKDAKQDSPYLLAGASGHMEILKLTLSHGADLKSTNRYGGTALIPAAERGHVEVVRTLIAAGVKVDHVNNLGWTALLEAIILSDGGKKHQDILAQLIQAGADVNLADKKGVSPLEHARERGYKEMVQQLQNAGAK